MRAIIISLCVIFLLALPAFYGTCNSRIAGSSDDAIVFRADAEVGFDGSRMYRVPFLSDFRPTANPQPRYNSPRTLAAYLDKYPFPTEFIGYASGHRRMELRITSFEPVSGMIEYEARESGYSSQVSQGKGTLLIDAQLLKLPFAKYRVKVDDRDMLMLEATKWRNTPFTTLDER